MTRHRASHVALVAALRRRSPNEKREGAIYRRGLKPQPSVGSAARRQRARALTKLGPVPLPLRLGRRKANIAFVVFGTLYLLAGPSLNRSAGWTVVRPLALIVIPALLVVELLQYRKPLVEIDEDGIRLWDADKSRKARWIERNRVVCLVDTGRRMRLRVRGARELIDVPTKGLSPDERFLLARCLTHYDLSEVFA